MGFLIGLGAAGFAIVLIFFTKLSSLTPVMRAAVIGARIIIGSCVLLIVWWLRYEHNQVGKDLFGNLMIDRQSLIGQWQTNYTQEDGEQYESVFSFYPDSTFYSNNEGNTGNWYYDEKRNTLSLDYGTAIHKFELASFIDRTLTAKNMSTFFKMSNVPETKENIAKAIELKQEQEQQEINKYAGISLEGTWGLKEIRYDGLYDNELGAYTLSNDGTGFFKDTYYSGQVTYSLDKAKKRLKIARNDKIYSIRIESFNEDEIVGFATGERDTKYVFAKAL